MAVDRYQTICYPMVNRVWKPQTSHKKIAVAWIFAIALCSPQAVVFGTERNEQGFVSCSARFDRESGTEGKDLVSSNRNHTVKIFLAFSSTLYVGWFVLSSFFIPLSALLYCYANICAAIRRNLISKQNPSVFSGTPTTSVNVSASLKFFQHPLASAVFLKKNYNNTSTETVSLPGSFHEDNLTRPRTHSIEGITRAKMKSVKQTIVIIFGYVACSSPAVAFLLWTVLVDRVTNLCKKIHKAT